MPMFRKGLLTLACLWGLVGGVFANNVRAEGSTLVVSEVPVFSLKSRSTDGSTPAERAEALAQTLSDIVDTSTMLVKKRGRTHVLFVGGQRILTITTQEAKLQRSTTAALATSWSAKLQSAFALPALKLSTNAILTTPGQTKFVKVVGGWAHLAEVTVNDSDVAIASRVPGGIKVQTVGVGEAAVSVSYPDGVQTISLDIRPLAANFPQTVAATVTGFPAIGSTVRGAIEGAIRTQFQSQNNAKLKFTVSDYTQLQEGVARTFAVKVRADAPNAFPATGTVNVVVRNTNYAGRRDAELWYCNDPENVRQAGPLFSSTLRKNFPVRLLYHHINASSSPLYIRVQAINDTDTPARIALMPGDAPPDRNPVRAGLKAALQYFSAWNTTSGEVLTIPPRSTLPISLRRLGPGDTISGLCGLRLVEGPDTLLIRTDAWPPFQLEAAWIAAISSSTPWQEVGTHPINDFDRASSELSMHIYPNPYRSEEVQYGVGGRYGFVRIGLKPISRQDLTSQLDGNFGVIYNIKANVENKTSVASDVEVVFESSAGYSGGLFLVNGQIVETPLMQPKAESRIARFRLEPGATKRFDIVTLPLSGSSYPATLTIRPFQDLNPGITDRR